MTGASDAEANRRGILAMIGAMGCFIVNDSLVKYASQALPAGQLIFVRGLFATAMVLAVCKATGALAHIHEIARGWVALRAVIDAVATILYLVALFHLPIANATAIQMTTPLIITVLAALVIGERVGLGRWLATSAGFVGVLLIIQPRGEGFNVYALVCLLAALLLSIRDLLTRRVHSRIPSILVTLSSTVAVTLLAGTLMLFDGWRSLAMRELAVLAIAAIFLATAYFLIVYSTRNGDFSLISPFRYSGLLFATISGYAVWGDVPNALAWLGIALIAGAGLYILRASRRPFPTNRVRLPSR